MGSDKKKYRREENKSLNGFFVQTHQGRMNVKDLDEVKDALNTLGEPYRKALPNLDFFYFFVIFAWNLSFAPEEQFGKELDNFLQPYKSQEAGAERAARALILDLVERKKALFPRDRYTFGSYLDSKGPSVQ